MKTFTGGSAVAGGYYLDVRKWEMVPVAASGATLRGTSADRYLRISMPWVLLLAPILGGLFVVFLPLIGFALAGHAAVRSIRVSAVAAADPSQG